MEDIIDNMPDYQYVVEFVNRHYYICPKYECGLLLML